jgi:hypothetical protein
VENVSGARVEDFNGMRWDDWRPPKLESEGGESLVLTPPISPSRVVGAVTAKEDDVVVTPPSATDARGDVWTALDALSSGPAAAAAVLFELEDTVTSSARTEKDEPHSRTTNNPFFDNPPPFFFTITITRSRKARKSLPSGTHW